MSFISFIITLCLMSFSLYSFALSPVPEALKKEPYKVIGVACLPGEICQQIEEGKHKGYYFKTNVRLKYPRPKDITKAPELQNLRNNMFTKAVLERELSKKDNELHRTKNNIRDLIDLAQSCTGKVCTRRDDGCGFTVIEGFNEEGIIAHRAVCDLPSNITPEELATMKARAGMCLKYTRAPLPESGSGGTTIVGGTATITEEATISNPFPPKINIRNPQISESKEGGGNVQ